MKTTETRRYDSTLRAEQAEQTAERILDAVVRRLQKGDRKLSYAAIAREAGVSTPTVYRHFPTRDDLYRAFAARDRAQRGGDLDLARLRDQLRELFRRADDPDDPMSQGRLNAMWEFSRVGTVPLRREAALRALDTQAPGLPGPDREAIADLITVLISSAAGEAFRGYLELDASATADRVAYAVEALLAHARTLAARAPADPPPPEEPA